MRFDRAGRVRLLELFAALNLAFLSFDVYLAHSVNDFAHRAECIPMPIFRPALLLVPCIVCDIHRPLARWGGAAVGLVSILVGVGGMLLHLEAAFFHEQTLKALVYTAPFSAPLAYVGIGLLLWLNRLEATDADWGRWVVLLAWGGFVGNFALAVLDHAQNGFFFPSEWISVAAAAAATGFLLVFVFLPDRSMLLACGVVLVLEAVVGVLGAWLHLSADLGGPADSFWDNLLYGAPVFAPLLFSNLALLAGLGLWDVAATQTPPPATAETVRAA